MQLIRRRWKGTRIAMVLLTAILFAGLMPVTAKAALPGAPSYTEVSRLDFLDDVPEDDEDFVMIGTDNEGTAFFTASTGFLVLQDVKLKGDEKLLAVPEGITIELRGENEITATAGSAVFAKGNLKIVGDGSLTVYAAANEAAQYALDADRSAAGNSDIDVDITGDLTIEAGGKSNAIRSMGGSISVKSGGAIEIKGDVWAPKEVAIEAGSALSMESESREAINCGSATEVSLTAGNGDLTVKGTSADAIYAPKATVTLDAAGDLYVEGNGSRRTFKTNICCDELVLSGTIPESTIVFTSSYNVTIPAGKSLTNKGNIKYCFCGDDKNNVTVKGKLSNSGSIRCQYGHEAKIKIEAGGILEETKAYLDFTSPLTPSTGTGYAWDSASKTLTLTNFSMEADWKVTAILLPDGAAVELNGRSSLFSANEPVLKSEGSLKITGEGSLTGTASGNTVLETKGELVIEDASVELKTTIPEPSGSTHVIDTNGGKLTIDGTADVRAVVENYEKIGGWGVGTGSGGVYIGTESALHIDAYVGIMVNGGGTDVPVQIFGTLEVNCGERGLCANLLGAALDISGSSISMTEGGKLYLYYCTTPLEGETQIRDFVGKLEVAHSGDSNASYYTVKTDDKIALYRQGSTVEVEAEQLTGRQFRCWIAEGVELTEPEADCISFTMPEKKVILSAQYIQLCNITASAQPSEAGSVDAGNGVYAEGDTATVTARANPGYQFIGWEKDGIEVSTDLCYEFTVSESTHLTAVFAVKKTDDDSKSDTDDGDSSSDDDNEGDADSGDSSSDDTNERNTASAGQGTDGIYSDAKKGYMSAGKGVITGEADGCSRWMQDETGWWLQYADGSYPRGYKTADQEGNEYEIYTWEFINGAWWRFDARGYVKAGWEYDVLLEGWFYVDADAGMMTGWQLIEAKWYYFHEISDGRRGRLYLDCMTPDGYYVDKNGVWAE